MAMPSCHRTGDGHHCGHKARENPGETGRMVCEQEGRYQRNDRLERDVLYPNVLPAVSA